MKTILLAAAVLVASLAASRAPGQTLDVDATLGNSPYVLNSGTLTDQNLVVGSASNGIFNQYGGVNIATVYCNVGVYNYPTITTGTYNLYGGVLDAAYVQGGGSVSTFIFDGGTLEAYASSTNFFSGFTNASVEAALMINPNGYSVTLNQNFVSYNTYPYGTDGGLQVVGTGTVILTGANSYRGFTVINAGTLQVGSGSTDGTLGTSPNPITNNGTLAFNRSDNITVANAVDGAGRVVQSGPGTLTLTGTSNYTGGTTVTGGTLSVSSDAALGTSSGKGYDLSNGMVTLSGSGKLLITGTSFATGRTFNLTSASSVISEASGGSMTFQSGAVATKARERSTCLATWTRPAAR